MALHDTQDSIFWLFHSLKICPMRISQVIHTQKGKLEFTMLGGNNREEAKVLEVFRSGWK